MTERSVRQCLPFNNNVTALFGVDSGATFLQRQMGNKPVIKRKQRAGL
jgi:hypothetical protein